MKRTPRSSTTQQQQGSTTKKAGNKMHEHISTAIMIFGSMAVLPIAGFMAVIASNKAEAEEHEEDNA